MPTKQQKLNQLDSNLAERRAYLQLVEHQIEDITNAGNNRLFELQGEIDKAEKELARILKKTYELDQMNRERLANSR